MDTGPVKGDQHALHEAIGAIARESGRFAIECSDVGGNVLMVRERIVAQADLLGQLRITATDLLAEQEDVADAAAEARAFAGQARGHLERSKPVVDGAMETFAGLTDLVVRLGERMDRLEDALRQVQAVARTIDQIGRQTNLLALNATLEAARAGEAGRGFAIVAGEVKKLASDSRNAGERIARTIEQLNQEAKGIGDEIDAGVTNGGEARARTAELSQVLGETLHFVDALDGRSGHIAEASLKIRSAVHSFQLGVTGLSSEAQANCEVLATASDRLATLETASNGLLNLVAGTGAPTADTPFI